MYESNPDPIGSPTFRPQHMKRLEDLRIIAERADDALRYTMDGSSTFDGYPEGSDLVPVGFWARLTGPALDDTTALYSWAEIQDDGTDGNTWTSTNTPNSGVANASEINNNTKIVVPGPPTSLSAAAVTGGSLPVADYFYVVTATWEDVDSNVFDSQVSNEATVTITLGANSALLAWSPPADADGFTLTGYKVWRGTEEDGENVLVTSTDASTVGYTDNGIGGSSSSPVFGGTVGPVVWLSPQSSEGFFKFSAPKPTTKETTLKLLISPPTIPTGAVGVSYHQVITATVVAGPLVIGTSEVDGGIGGTGGVLVDKDGLLTEPSGFGASEDGNLYTKSNSKPDPSDLSNGQGQFWFSD